MVPMTFIIEFFSRMTPHTQNRFRTPTHFAFLEEGVFLAKMINKICNFAYLRIR
jgi:hypothetical protein